MSKSRGKRLGFWAVLWALAFPAACGSSGVVGGKCSASHIDCNGQCVDAQNDANNCGGCGRKCPNGVSCEDALCDGMPAGGSGGNGGSSGHGGDAGSGADFGAGGSSAAAGEDDAGNLTDASPDGDAGCLPPYNTAEKCGDCETQCTGSKPNCAPYGEGEYVCVGKCQPPLVECKGQCVEPVFDTPQSCGSCNTTCTVAKPLCTPNSDGVYECTSLCEPPLVECNGQCVEPIFDTPEACGACNAACPMSKPTCSPDGGSFKCVLVCEDPLEACNGKCVDFNIDPNNCGSCGNVCLSGICQGGMCVGAKDGHVVLECMNFQAPVLSSPAADRVLGNAVLLPAPKQVRILAYTEFVSPAARALVDQHINFAANAAGRSVVITELNKYTNASVVLAIGKFDEFLIYEQDTAPPGQLATVGTAWQMNAVLDSFTAAGGVIVGLSGGSTEMYQLFTNAQLLDISGQTVVTGSFLYNRASGDSVGNNVISPFSAPSASCSFTTSATPGPRLVFVVADAPTDPSKPVVVHRSIPKPP